ncbi:hypothetical protein RQP46_001676 [Phenoliferia psychrophenolica]
MAKKERRQPQRAAATVAHVSADWVTRRVQRHINDLERTNYTEPTSGPSAFGQNEDGDDDKGAGAASVLEDQARRKKKSTNAVRQLLLYRKTLATLVDESNLVSAPKSQWNYVTAVAPPSMFPPMHLCSVCGWKGNYGCPRCGLKILSSKQSVILERGGVRKLALRPPSLAAALSKAETVFFLPADSVALEVSFGGMWVEVLEDGWDSAVLSAQDPLALKVVDKVPPTSHKRGRSTPTEEVDAGHVCDVAKARKSNGQQQPNASSESHPSSQAPSNAPPKQDWASIMSSLTPEKFNALHPNQQVALRELIARQQMLHVAAPAPAPSPTPVDDSITLKFCQPGSGAPSVSVKVQPTTRCDRIFDRVASQMGKDVGDLLFRFDEWKVDPRKTVRENDLGDGDTIDVHIEQKGGKPVIYLFPPTPLASVRVDLSLVPEWTFSALYPVVPINRSKAPHSGTTATWTVTASPSGDLVELSSGLSLSYLFWEAHTCPTPPSPSLLPMNPSQIPAFNPSSTTLTPSTALALTFSTFLPYLDTVLSTLTLHISARNDFITYWLPKFNAIQDRGQRIAFRFVEQAAYEQAARLEVEPTPDVVRRVFMTFKGVDGWRGGKFRVLEWGGMELVQ